MIETVQIVEEYQFAQEKCDKAAFELRNMMGTGILDLPRLLQILEAKAP